MIAEAVTALARKTSRAHAAAAGREIHVRAEMGLGILDPLGEDDARALELMERFEEARLRDPDCLAFAILRRLRIRLAFTTDRRPFCGLGGFALVP
jgi:predicted nucleic acid-binding protein